MVSEKRLREIQRLLDAGAETGLSASTIRKYRSYLRSLDSSGILPNEQSGDKIYEALKNNYTEEELRKLARAPRHYPAGKKEIDFDGDTVKFAFVTDTHFGAACFDENCWDAFLEECKKENVSFITHAGDVCDGTPRHRMDSIYGMEVIGYSNQKKYARELFAKTDIPIYAISGNHDRFYRDAQIVEDICEPFSHCHYVGEDKGTVTIHTSRRDLNILLWHGDDGSAGQSYSLRVQKIIEGLSIYEPVDLLLTGHTHKACTLYNANRNIYAISGGALCGQSDWMRSKRLENHQGFYIIEVTIGERGVLKVNTVWYPLNEHLLYK